MSSGTWGQFVDSLAAHLQLLIPGDKLILSRGRQYVQLARGADDLHAEAVSNAGLPPDHQLTPAQERALRELGWRPPHPDTFFNYWHDARADKDLRQVASLLARTLRDVYRIESPEALQREAWSDDGGPPAS
jgi:hypothetical protein